MRLSDKWERKMWRLVAELSKDFPDFREFQYSDNFAARVIAAAQSADAKAQEKKTTKGAR